MTFVETIAATLVIVVFIVGVSFPFYSVWRAWEKAEAEHRIGQTLRFVSETFKSECAKEDRDMERWKQATSAAWKLEGLDLIEMKEGEVLRALKARIVIGGECFEVIGLCRQ